MCVCGVFVAISPGLGRTGCVCVSVCMDLRQGAPMYVCVRESLLGATFASVVRGWWGVIGQPLRLMSVNRHNSKSSACVCLCARRIKTLFGDFGKTAQPTAQLTAQLL